MRVSILEAQETYPIRHEILRPGWPLESAHFDGDNDASTFHLGIDLDGHLASVASFYLRSSDLLRESVQYQLRGMATLTAYQGKGLGSALIGAALPALRQRGCDVLWCNARESAIGFYGSVDFVTIGPRFNIPAVGPHYVMFRKLF